MCIGRELASGIEQGLFDLVVGRKSHLEIEVQVASPKGDDGLERLGCKGSADTETE